MATATKKKPAAKKKAPARKPAAKKAPVKKAAASSVSRRQFITRSDEYTQLTWVLICIWLVLVAIFLGTVVSKMG
jgi:hypothetical protein